MGAGKTEYYDRGMNRGFQKSVCVLVLLMGWNLAAARTHYVRYTDANWDAIIGPPPTPHSRQQKDEIDELLAWQSKRTEAQEKRCRAEAHVNAFYFSRVLGAHFDQHDLPITAQLLRDAASDVTEIDDDLKRHWNQPRPYLTDKRIEPCVPLETATSYPSGHAIRGIVWARILAEIFPEKTDALMSAGRQLGEDRIIAGMHYPSDVAAGQKLGETIADKLLANRDFRKELEKAKEECLQSAH